MKYTYKGKTIYVGIDVHDKSWDLQILTSHSIQQHVHLRPASCESLYSFLSSHYPEGIFRSKTNLSKSV